MTTPAPARPLVRPLAAPVPASISAPGPAPASVPAPAAAGAAAPIPASLDLPACGVLTALEVAARLGVTKKHIYNLIDEGELGVVDLSVRDGALRRTSRIPLEAYRDFVVLRLRGTDQGRTLIAALPEAVRLELACELLGGLPPAARTAVLHDDRFRRSA